MEVFDALMALLQATSGQASDFPLSMMLCVGGIGVAGYSFNTWGELPAMKPRVLVLGTGPRLQKFAEVARHSHVIAGYVALETGVQPGAEPVPSQNIVRIAKGESLVSVALRLHIDQIVVGVGDRRGGGLPVQALLECRLKGIRVTDLPDFFERECRQVLLESLKPSWMIFGAGFRFGLFAYSVKRLLDICASVALLLAALPVLLLSALCLVVESGFPIFYRQERVGRDGRVFTLYKLRSMRNDAEHDGTPRWAVIDDDRATRVGRILRKLRIDELPQIINVLKGEMSFVGPRPERPFFVERLAERIPYYAMRHSIKPGITGWAQVSCAYGASTNAAIEKLQYDLYYVKNHSVWLDLLILLQTIEVVLLGKGAR